MVIRKIDTMLFRMIKNSKSQFVAVLLIIIVGICVYTSLNMTSINMRNTIESYYSENNFPDLFIQTAPIPSQAVSRLARIEGVKNVNGRISLDVPFVTEGMDERVNIRIITMTDNDAELSKSTIVKGHSLSDSGNEALLIQQFATARGIEIGEEIKVQIKGIQYTLNVVGIVANPEYIYLMENVQSMMPAEDKFGICYISERLGQQAAGLPGSYNEVIISYENGADEEQLIDDVEDELDRYGIMHLVERENQLSNAIIEEELTNLGAMANSLPILFLLVAGLILMMMLSRMVKRDRIKIGVLKALGYQSSRVLFHYVKYAILAGIIGGIIGSILGMALAGAMTKLYLQYFNVPLLKTEFYYSYLLLAMLLAPLFCTVSGVVGAKEVLKISPADAMREDAPRSGKRILIERVPFIWKRLAFSNKIVVKNIFRNKKRTIFILAGVILTYGMMLFTTSMPNVMDQMMSKHFKDFQKMEYNISFTNPVEKRAINELSEIIDVDYLEGKIEYPFELSNGNKKQSVNVIGLKSDTRFYSFQEPTGKPIFIPSKGILLSENLAKSLKVTKGDYIQLKNFLPNRGDEYLLVKGIVKQALGMNAYMEIDYMGELLLESNIITGVYFNSSDTRINEKLMYATNISTIMSTGDMMAVYDDYMQMVVLYIGSMVIFSGILGFCIVYNATIVSIGEREMELSSLRVLGFSKKEIFLMILKENNIIMILGILLGIPFGKMLATYSTAAFSTDIYSLDMSPTLMAGISAAVLTIAFILFAQLATYRKIKRLDFLQAIKNRAS